MVNTDNQLPDGWKWSKVEDIADVGTGATPLRNSAKYWYGGTIPWVTSGALNKPFVYEANEFVTELALQETNVKLFPAGTLLVAMYGEGKTRGKVSELMMEATTNQACAALVFRGSAVECKPFVKLFFEKNYEDLRRLASGGVQPNLNLSIIKNTRIPFPPLREQKRIVDRVEELFTKLDAGTSALNRVQARLRRYTTSVLKAAFEGKLVSQQTSGEPTNQLLERVLGKDYQKKIEPYSSNNVPYVPPGWIYGRLENLIYIAARIGWRGLKAEEYTEQGPLFLSVYNLNNGDQVDFSETYHISEERYDESPEIMLQENDILLAKDGAGIGKIGIIKGLPRSATVNSSLLVIRASEIFIPEFLFYFLKGPQMQDVVRARITGSATPHLFQRDIKQFTLLIPPLEEQARIVAEIDRRLSTIRKAESAVVVALTRASRLRQAILKSAFEGKLVQQNPLDETVDQFLDQIKDMRNLEDAHKKGIARKIKEKKVSIKPERKSLYEILMAAKGARLTPEQLFKNAGFDDSHIDEFYDELRKDIQIEENGKIIKKGRIRQVRPDNTTVYLEVV